MLEILSHSSHFLPFLPPKRRREIRKTQLSFFDFSPHFQISLSIEADFRKYLLSLMCKRSKESDMDNLMRKLPIGIQTFEDIRRKNYLYVDKTALVWRMANLGKPYFLSRPRRFGKSLLLSTFESYFLGKKELFEGLAIEQMETEWTEHPVLHLDLNAEKYDKPEKLNVILSNHLTQWELQYG